MKQYIYAMLGLLLFAACSNVDDPTGRDEGAVRLATVTLMVTPNGLGDNGYNDAAADGVFAFAGETGTRLRLLRPMNEEEAETMYRQWLTDNAAQDSAVLILGSSAYEDIARKVSETEQDKLKALQEHGSRVLLFESDAEIEGVTTVMISRYGVSWLAGAMSQNFNALILAAAKGIPTLEESMAGFQDARSEHPMEGTERQSGMTCMTMLHYLADDVTGFAMPDSAYRYITQRADDAFNYDEMIFPLLGGSEAGVLRFRFSSLITPFNFLILIFG